MQMRITFLGTGTSTGVPLIGCRCPVCQSTDARDKRLRASVILDFFDLGEPETRPSCAQTTSSGPLATGTSSATGTFTPPPVATLLIDAGPDFRQQMLAHHTVFPDAILITHAHKDHVGGLDDVRAFNFMTGRPVQIYAEPSAQMTLKKDYDYAFVTNKSYLGAPQMFLHTIDGQPFWVGNQTHQFRIVPVRAMHQRLPIYGFRIGPFGYLTDVSEITPNEWQKFLGVEIMVISAVQSWPHRSHFHLDRAIHLANVIAAPQTYLTHISHGLPPHARLCEQLPPEIQPAYDGLSCVLPFTP